MVGHYEKAGLGSMIANRVHPVTAINSGLFTLTIEPGHEEMWFAMRDLRGPFSADDVAVAVDGKTSVVTRYIRHLIRLNIAEEAGLSTDRKVLFRIASLGIVPVVLDSKGDVSADYALRRQLWMATRRFKHCVTEGKLLDEVGEHIEVTQRQVKNWIARLVAADYLTEMYGHYSKPKTGQKEYCLRQLRDTGPHPPRFCEATLIFDVNLALRGPRSEAFFGEGQAHEVKL
jgi:hypothetical protein